VARRVTAYMTRWRDGDMRRRWCVAGLLRAEGQFCRVKEHAAMPALLKALKAAVRGDHLELGVTLRESTRRSRTSNRPETCPIQVSAV
jgi:hypothetical protein